MHLLINSTTKLRVEALEAISGCNDIYKIIVVDVLKRRLGRPQLIVDAIYHIFHLHYTVKALL